MLSEIRIDGLGVIAEATASFSEGLTVLTGETGAGKTMVVTSLHLLSGARADAGRVRVGADRAVVEGRFTTDHVTDQVRGDVEQLLESTGGRRDEDDSIIALRTVGSDGRSRAHLGGRSVPAGVLSEFTGSLLTVHGQNDQLRLQRSDQQLAALDRFAADAIGPLLETYRTRRSQWVAAVTELRERTEKARELAREADQLTFALNEIDAVAPAPHEDTDIAATVRRLSDLDSLRDAASAAHTALTGGDDPGDVSVMALLGEARDRLASTDDEILSAVGPRLAEAIAVVTDVGAELTSYLEDLPADPESLDTLLSRQAELKSLTRKYAADVDGVLAWAEDARTRLTGLDVSADAVAALTERVSTTGAATAEVARKLSAARVKAAAKLSKAVSAELAGLAMGKAKLDVEVRPALRVRTIGRRCPSTEPRCTPGRPAPTRSSSVCPRTAVRSRCRSTRARPAVSSPA